MPFSSIISIELIIMLVLVLIISLVTYLVIRLINYYKNKHKVNQLNYQVTTIQKGLKDERLRK